MLRAVSTSVPLFAAAALTSITLVSCNSTSPGSSAYASNGHIDGGYNPYPNGGGGIPAGSLLSSNTPQYTEAPPPPPSGYEKPVEREPVSKPKTKTTPTSSSKPSSPKPVASTSASKPKPTASKSSGSTHVVVAGDTLWGIARKNGTTVEKIKSANGLSSDKLKLGLKLKIP